MHSSELHFEYIKEYYFINISQRNNQGIKDWVI